MEFNHKIEVKNISEMHLATVKSIGVQNMVNAYDRLIAWAIAKNLFQKENVKMITVYHDSFRTTPPDMVRMSAGMLMEEPMIADGDFLPETIPSGKYIVGSYLIPHEEFGNAWRSLFQWMNENGYQFKNTPPFEMYHNNYQNHPEKKSMVDFYIPIED